MSNILTGVGGGIGRGKEGGWVGDRKVEPKRLKHIHRLNLFGSFRCL